MKKGKLVLKVAVGITALGLLFTGCNNEDATAKKDGNAITITKPVTSEQDVISCLTKSLEETTAFGQKTARAAAKDGKAAGTQLAEVQNELVKFVTENYDDVSRLFLGMINVIYLPSKDMEFGPTVNLADITPSDVLSTFYYYMASYDKDNKLVAPTYDEFISKNKLTQTRDFLESYDKYVELSKLNVGVNGKYVADTKKLQLSTKAGTGLRFNDINGFAKASAEEFGHSADDVNVPLRYLSFSGDADGLFAYTYGESKTLTGFTIEDILKFIKNTANLALALDFKGIATQLVDDVSLNASGDLRFNLVTSEGQGGYFTIKPSVNGSLAKYEDDVKIYLSVADNDSVTFEQTYSLREFTKVYGEKFGDVINASIKCIPTSEELNSLIKSVIALIPSFTPADSNSDLKDLADAIDRLF